MRRGEGDRGSENRASAVPDPCLPSMRLVATAVEKIIGQECDSGGNNVDVIEESEGEFVRMALELDIPESLVLAEGAHNGHTTITLLSSFAFVYVPTQNWRTNGGVPSHRRQPKVLALVLSDKGSLQFMVFVRLFSSEIQSIESNCGYKLAKQWNDELQDDKFVISFCLVSPT